MNNIFRQNTVNAILFQVSTDLINSENLKVPIAQLCHDLQVCNFTMLLLIQKQMNNILFKQNSLNAISFKSLSRLSIIQKEGFILVPFIVAIKLFTPLF